MERVIEPVVGRENLRATVTADIDFSETMSVTEEYKPNQGESATAAVRVQQTLESNQGSSSPPSGVPGAQSNQPPTPATAPATGGAAPLQGAQAGANTSGRRELTTNYEVDKTQRTTRAATGTIKRLSAAVVLNHKTTTDARGKSTSTPWTQEELDKLTALVQQGIGFSKDRGDTVKLINAPFRVAETPKADPLPLWQQPHVLDLVRSAAVPAALSLVAVLVLFGLVRPALKAALPPPTPVGPAARAGQLQAVVDERNELPSLAGPPTHAALPAPATAEWLTQARTMARENPNAVAGIVRGWVAGEA